MKTLVKGLLFILSSVAVAAETVPTDIQQPGTQPGEVTGLESPDKCDNCHGGYNAAVEPAHNWRGSMMAHAGRDPIFWATLAVAEQDFDGAGDLCVRCHSTAGWLAGRSTPTDGSGLAQGDSDGVECDFCHKMTNPDNSEHVGTMSGSFVANQPEPNNDSLFDWDPPHTFVEAYLGSGMSAIWGGSDKLGPYNDADARHQFMESTFHRDRDFCGTCHDVSNPATGDLAHNHGAQATADPVIADGTPGAPVEGKAAFNNAPYKYGVVERTFSEYKSSLIPRTLVSEFPNLPADLQGGALEAIYNAATLGGTTDGNYQNPSAPRYFSCQSCHLRPVTGTGANKRGVPERADLPLHDMTGGNYWMPEAIRYLNDAGKLRLGGGMTDYQVTAMLDGALRAREQLELAATLSISGNGNSVKIVNHTGHKLISGYPEGRRMWLNIKWYDANGQQIREDGEYGEIGVTINGTSVKSLVDLNGANTKIYEAHMGMTREWASQLIGLGYPVDLPLTYDRFTGAVECRLGNLAQADDGQGGSLPPCTGDPEYQETFHFVLNNAVITDNRIPPYGMSYELARIRNALPVPADQYGGVPGGTYDYFDEVALNVPSGAHSAEIHLMYQPTSWEYIQFLYLANNGPDPAQNGNAFLGNEGTNLLEAWLNTGMAEPHVMARATWGAPPSGCTAVVPTLLSAAPGDKQIATTWQEVTSEPELLGYKLYYDQAGKGQLVTDLACPPGTPGCTAYTDSGLTNGQEYCYKVTSYTSVCESGFSNVLCAIPTQPGQEVTAGVIEPLLTGKWVTEGKGKNAATSFVITAEFLQGDDIVIRATVEDENAAPVADAIVTVAIAGPENVSLTTTPSDASGVAEAVWNTLSPRKREAGTATGTYTATVTGLTASGYVWNQTASSVTFTISP
ncbi:MAG: Ig-like domain-containing protein [Chromatiales bacterium]|nr:Ig-like domain-containing protein [Chromatiales bacterium]MDH3932136.1 Ig-like domain-containing protein [Chromatiales bacterium]MDH4013254.1 Ig-like domain-containing protein [Chromatiales bacterium]